MGLGGFTGKLLGGALGTRIAKRDARAFAPLKGMLTVVLPAALGMVLACVQLSGYMYRTTLKQLMAQRELLRFARQDPPTGLDNRLALRECFKEVGPGRRGTAETRHHTQNGAVIKRSPCCTHS